MKNKIQDENFYISKPLLEIFVSDKILDYDGSLDSLKLNKSKEINFIYRSEILEDYINIASNFFQNLSIDKDLEVDDLKSFVQSLFEGQLECFIITLRKMLKNETTSFNDLDFIMKFTGTYFGKYLPKDYVLERIVFKFNNDNLLSKYTFIQSYLKTNLTPNTNFDLDIFKSEKGYLIFKDFSESYVMDAILDLGFIFQILKTNNLIIPISHIQFADWLLEKKLLTEKTHTKIKENGGFGSLKKLSSDLRLNLYLKLKEKYLK